MFFCEFWKFVRKPIFLLTLLKIGNILFLHKFVCWTIPHNWQGTDFVVEVSLKADGLKSASNKGKSWKQKENKTTIHDKQRMLLLVSR